MRIKEITVIVTSIDTTITQGVNVAGMQMKPQQNAVSFRFEISPDEIELLQVSEREMEKMGRNIAKALLAFAQAGYAAWEDKEEEHKLSS